MRCLSLGAIRVRIVAMHSHSTLLAGLLCALVSWTTPLWGQEVASTEASSDATSEPSRAHYTIKAEVDPANRRLQGELTLRWRNGTEVDTSELWFHLHHNAYANNRSTHLTEADGSLRGVNMTEGWGWQSVTRLEFEGTDLTGGIELLAPEPKEGEGEAHDHGDRTVFRVPLPREVAPGEEVSVNLTWESLIPRVRRRTGIKDDFLMMSHWFPKLGVFEGERGWNCHRFHQNSEFFADYGTYDVTLNLPERFADVDKDGKVTAKVGASGGLAEPPRVEQERLIVRYLAPTQADRGRMDPITQTQPVLHGFAWTADPEYRIHEERFVFADWAEKYHTEVQAAAIAFRKPLEQIRLRDVQVTVLIQPEHEGQWRRHYEATAAALFFYGLWWGEYPYERVTVVDPAWGARAAGGMEYPTLFTAGTSRFTSPSMHRPEGVTVHEAGHQFWYGLVGNNEYEAAWLDEGLNSYTDSEVLWRHYGLRRSAQRYSSLPVWGRSPASTPSASGWAGTLSGQQWKLPNPMDWAWMDKLTLEPAAASPFVRWYRDLPSLTFVEEFSDPRWGDRSGYLRNPDVDPIETFCFHYRDRGSYRTNSYPRTAVALRSLVGVVGRDAFLRGMRHYADQWRYRHPYPKDFYAAFQEGAEVDVQWYFDDLFRGTGTVDWEVRVSDAGALKDKGLFLEEDGVWRDAVKVVEEVTPEESLPEDEESSAEAEEGAEEEEVASQEPAPEAPSMRRQEVIVQRRGTLRLPLPIKVRFVDGTETIFTWTREAQEESTWWRLPLPPTSSKIEWVLLDPDRHYYLDTNMTDNQWYRETDSVRAFRWGERVFTQYTHLLHFFSTLGG